MLSIESFFYTLLLLLLALWVALNRREFGLTQFFCCIFILVYGFGFHIYHFESEYEAEVINITARWLSVSVIAIFGGIIFANFLIAKRDQKSNIGGAELPPQGLRLISLAIILLFIYHLTFGGGLQGLMGVSVLGKEDIATGEFEQLRAGAGGGAGGLYAYLSLAIAPFFALLAFAHWWQARSNFSLVLMLAFLGIVLLGKLSTLHKFPAVFFLAQIGLLAVIFNKSMARSKKVILLLIVAIGVVVMQALVYYFSTVATGIVEVIDLMSFRVFNEPNRVLSLYFQYWPSYYDFFWGMNTRQLFWLAGGDLNNFIPAHSLVAPLGTTFNAIFIADAWVDYGPFGIIFQCFFVGFLLRTLDIKFLRAGSYLGKVVLVGCSYGVVSLNSTGLITCLFGFGLLMIPFSVFIALKLFGVKRGSGI